MVRRNQPRARSTKLQRSPVSASCAALSLNLPASLAYLSWQGCCSCRRSLHLFIISSYCDLKIYTHFLRFADHVPIAIYSSNYILKTHSYTIKSDPVERFCLCLCCLVRFHSPVWSKDQNKKLQKKRSNNPRRGSVFVGTYLGRYFDWTWVPLSWQKMAIESRQVAKAKRCRFPTARRRPWPSFTKEEGNHYFDVHVEKAGSHSAPWREYMQQFFTAG